MDSNGHLRHITPEELYTMEGLDHPVDSVADIPEWKVSGFKAVDKAVNRKERKRLAKRLKVSWSEYQIYRSLL